MKYIHLKCKYQLLYLKYQDDNPLHNHSIKLKNYQTLKTHIQCNEGLDPHMLNKFKNYIHQLRKLMHQKDHRLYLISSLSCLKTARKQVLYQSLHFHWRFFQIWNHILPHQ